MLEAVHDRIDEVGVVPLQNKIGYSSGGFLELLRAYLQSLMVDFEGSRYIHKDGICIGAVIAPVLSGMFVAKCDKEIESRMLGFKVKRILRYVDDYLIIVEAMREDKKATFAKRACFRNVLVAFLLLQSYPWKEGFVSWTSSCLRASEAFVGLLSLGQARVFYLVVRTQNS